MTSLPDCAFFVSPISSRLKVDLDPVPLSLIPVHSFLNDVDRIAINSYKPSDDDVVRARLRTLGVQEHKFVFEDGVCASMDV